MRYLKLLRAGTIRTRLYGCFVVRFYNQGGKAADTRGRARHITELHLSEQDIADLVAFLEALTSPVEVKRLVVPEAYQATKMTP